MTLRDTRGERIPSGKIERQLRYDGIDATSAPEWLSVVGDASARKSDVADGRGELHLDVASGVGGFVGPGFDPEAFAELELRVGIRPTIGDDASLLVGFADEPTSPDRGGWCYFRESGDSGGRMDGSMETGHLWFGDDGDGAATGNVGKVTQGVAVLGVRIRPADRAVSIEVGGAGRGDVLYEDAACPYAFDDPVRPTIAIDAGSDQEPDRVSLATVRVTIRHN